MTLRPSLPLVGLATASVLALAGCASGGGAAPAADGRVQIVASTNVYGDLAAQVGGDLVDVTSVVSSAAQDPHSFEAGASDQLDVSRADLLIENGGGYDAFLDALVEASGTDAPTITAVEYSHDFPGDAAHEHTDDDADAGAAGSAEPEAEPTADHAEETDHADDHDHEHIEGFNEHVWYDPHTVLHVVEAIAEELGELRPDDAATFEDDAAELIAQIEGLEAGLEEISAAHEGEQVFVTEPVPLYLTAAAGLDNATPDAFSEAVEEGQDVPPATLLAALDELRSGEVTVVIANAQTGGAETTQIIDEAESLGIPVIEFSETLPSDQTYVGWMQDNIDALAAALDQ